MAALGVELIGVKAYVDSDAADGSGNGGRGASSTERLVTAAGADLGVAFNSTGERVWVMDERARPIPSEQLLLLFVSLAVRRGLRGRIAVPVTVSEQVERLVEGSGLEITRTTASRAALAAASIDDDVQFAGADGGGFAFAHFLPAYDSLVSLCKLLELWAPEPEPLSALVAQLPSSTLVHADVHCPWALKGAAMRALIEDAKGHETENLDGLKVREDGGWVELLPDPDRPLFHIYAEGPTAELSEHLADRYRSRLVEIVERHGEG
jgi:mannose-1-phosphate guanylyltransferase/phosphomannomutase